MTDIRHYYHHYRHVARQKEPELSTVNQKDEMRKNNNKIKSSRDEESEDNGAEARVDSSVDRKQHKERDRDYNNNNSNNNNNNYDEQRDPSTNINDNGGINTENGSIGNNNDNNNDKKNNNINKQDKHLSYHQNAAQRNTDILPKNKGVLAQSVYIVSSGKFYTDKLIAPLLVYNLC